MELVVQFLWERREEYQNVEGFSFLAADGFCGAEDPFSFRADLYSSDLKCM